MTTGYVANIEEITTKNSHFREVLYTAKNCQLVVMRLLVGEEIGTEVHENVDQFFRIESGHAKFILNDEVNEVGPGMVVIIPAGTKHNVINIGDESLRLYTIYCPPNHPANTIHHLKSDAAEDE